jgi:GNAT superfamily N-acetyltransferase
MPVTVAVASAPLDVVLQSSLRRVYTDYPGFASPEAAVAVLAEAVSAGDTLYTAVFNARVIAAVLTRGAGETRHMRYLCVHATNLGRGVAERLVAEVCRLEAARGHRWLEADVDLNQDGAADVLLALGFTPYGKDDYRCRLSF